jgi:hypothetical protein
VIISVPCCLCNVAGVCCLQIECEFRWISSNACQLRLRDEWRKIRDRVLELASLAKSKNKDLAQLMDRDEEFDDGMSVCY